MLVCWSVPLCERNLPTCHKDIDFPKENKNIGFIGRKYFEFLNKLIRHDESSGKFHSSQWLHTSVTQLTPCEPHLLQVLRETLGFQCLLEKRNRHAWWWPRFLALLAKNDSFLLRREEHMQRFSNIWTAMRV